MRPPAGVPGCARREGLGERLAAALALALLATTASGAQATNDPPVDFRTVDLEGHEFQLASLRGEVVVLDFWAVWCAPCLTAIPALNEIHAARDTTGAHVVGIAMFSGGPARVRKLLEKHDSRYTKVMGNEELGEQFDVIGYPTYLLIDPQGRIRGRYVGRIEEELPRLQRDIAELRGASRP